MAAASGLAIIGGNQSKSGPFKPFGYQTASSSKANMAEMNHYGYMTGNGEASGAKTTMRARLGMHHQAFGTTFKQKSANYTSSSMRPAHAKGDRLQLNMNLQASKLPTKDNLLAKNRQ